MGDLSNHHGLNSNHEKELLIVEIKKLFEEASTHHTLQADEVKQRMVQSCSNTEMSGIIKDLTVISLHVLDAIGRLQPVNTITISKETGIPKGTVSKSIKRLAAKNLILKVPIPNNKKEVNFYVTPLGKEIVDLHHGFHRQFELGVSKILKKYDVEALQLLIRILKDFVGTAWGIRDNL